MRFFSDFFCFDLHLTSLPPNDPSETISPCFVIVPFSLVQLLPIHSGRRSGRLSFLNHLDFPASSGNGSLPPGLPVRPLAFSTRRVLGELG